MADPIQVFVFGDQTYDVCDLLSSLLRIQDDVILTTFLNKSCQTLKHEISKLSNELQTACPRFSKISELVSLSRQGLLNPALTQALSCICQIGTFLHDHVSPGKSFPTSNFSCLTGRCTGFLSAVAISCSSSPLDLSLLGVITVAIAFRVGAAAWDCGSRLSSSRNGTQPYPSWTVALSGPQESEVQACIEQFVSRTAIGKILAPYISARITPSRCSLSGRPDILRKLLSETSLSKCVTLALPITAPYHAEHLYTEDDIYGVLSDLDEWASNLEVRIPIISSSTGDLLWRTTFSDALRTSVSSCLQHTVRADLVPTGVATYIETAAEAAQFVIRHIAATPDALGTAVEDALGRQNNTRHINLEPRLEALPGSDSSTTANSKIAILSMSGRFPSAPDMESFWTVLQNGIDTHEMVPPSRWNSRTHVGDASSDRLAKNISGTGFGCWLHDAAQFDARYFNMSPREAPQVDPAQRLALLTATEALEQAGIVPGRTATTQRNRVGVYFGSTSNDWMETNSAQNIDTYFIPGGNRAFIPGRINYHFKFSGPSYTIDTACSSSLAAIHLACNALWKGEIDTAIVGGTNVLTNPDMTAGLDRGHFLSRTGNCKTFDDTADGYCRGEAVATAILKRLDDAIIDKDPVQACILAINTNHSAEAESITRPHVGAQQALFEDVLAEAGIQPSDVGYCEMHGTGTQAGDASEVVSVLQSLAPTMPSKATQSRDGRLYIGAAKANVGHGEAAAGVTSLAKALLMLKHSIIPPHCGIKTKINHKFPDLGSRNTAIAAQPLPWPRPAHGQRRILLNNFSAAGGNTALILEDPPASPVLNTSDARQDHVIAVSAKTPASLEKNIANLIAWAGAQEDKSSSILSRLSYTSTARRIHHPHRVMIIAPDLESAKNSLLRSMERKEGAHRSKGPPRYLFTFTGQGAQYAGMGVDLYKRLSSFRADIHRYEQICLQLELPPIEHLFRDPSAFAEATPTMLQLALVCFQMALYRMWVSFGIEPSAVVGHSLGEYAALYAASVLSQADVINIVGRRAQLLETVCEQDSHAMLAVRSNVTRLEALLGPSGAEYEISCLNGRESTVLGGTRTQMKAMRPTLSRSGLSHALLEVPYAFHTSQVDPVLESLRSVAEGIQFAKPAIPVISPTLGKVIIEAADLGADFVVQHCRVKVNMIHALEVAKEMHVIEDKMMGIEIGPAPIVANMVKEIMGLSFRTLASSRRDEDAHRVLAAALAVLYTAGANINWMAYHADFPSSHKVLDLPAYGWDLNEYWIQYVNDWSPRKGDPPPRAQMARLKSSSIHHVLKDTLDVSGGELILESDLSRADLHPMVQGHKVYGVPLCTPSVYADIALTIGEYAKVFLRPTSDAVAVEVADMAIHSALVANSDGNPQMLRTLACLDYPNRSISCTFSSVRGHDGNLNQHATCVIQLFDVQEALEKFESRIPHVKSQLSSLTGRVRDFGNTFRYSKGMIYKMIGQLADFDQKYRALEEITLDSDAFEAVGKVDFTKVASEGTFHTNPAQIDALSQLGGFVMNGNEGVDLGKELFVNHGWGSLRLFSKIESSKVYTTYVKMAEGANKLWTGDIMILDEGKVVGVFGQVALQGVPKRLIEYIVRSANQPLLDSSLHEPANRATSQVRVSSRVDTVANLTAHELVIHQESPATKACTNAINIISQESGIEVQELTDDIRFDDVGVDSLLSLMISSRIRDELGVDFESSVLLDLPTIGDFLTYLKGIVVDDENPIPVIEPFQEKVISVKVTTSSTREEKNNIDIWPDALRIIAEESGMSSRDLTHDTVFADMGMDSLLSLIVGGRLRDELQVDSPSHSLFLDFPTVASLQAHITGISQHFNVENQADSDLSATSSCPSLDAPATATPSSPSSPSESGVVSQVAEAPPLIKPAWSITLQGSARSAKHRIFLFPDGCGAATSYLRLPLVSSDTAIIGFNSPFMKSPHDMASHSLSDVVASYIQSLRKHQCHGPYHLGGWSAGGILAYTVAQNLIASGEEVATLTLIDSPPPNDGLDRLPQRFFDHCSKTGIFGTEMSAISRQRDTESEVSKLPDWLMPHFEATIELLHDYRAPPMSPSASSPRQINIIWAEDCAFDGHYAPLPSTSSEIEETEGVKFLTEQRKDFGPGKWADLFPGRSIHVDVVRGHHHFSMMRGEGAALIAKILRTALKASDRWG